MATNDLINTIIAEAGGEGEEGIIAATWAIAQRAAARGQTMDQVIRQGFDGFTNPGSGAQRDQRNPEIRSRVQNIISGVQSGSIPNPVPGADHFLSGDVMPSWAKSMKPVATIGGHRFYASGDVPQRAQGIPLPPGELPSVASALSVTRPVTPSMPTAMPNNIAQARTINAAMSNGMTAPSPDFYRGIFSPTQQASPRNINSEVNSANSGQDQSLAAALQSYVQRPAPLSAAEVYQYGGPTRPASSPPNITTVTQVPTVPRLPPISPPRNVPSNMFTETTQRAAAATDPALQSALSRIGKPPTTRVVPSVQVAAQSRSAPSQPTSAERAALNYVPPGTRAPLPTSAERAALSYVAPVNPANRMLTSAERSALSYVPPRATAQPNRAQVEAGTGFRTPNLSTQPSSAIKANDRLPGGVYPSAPTMASSVPAAAPAVVAPRLGVSAPVGMPTPSSMRPRGITGFPTPLSQRPMMSAQMGRPAMSLGARPPLNVVVQGARTMLPPQQAVQQQYINPSNHNPAQLAAIANGQSTFVSSPGSVSEPVRAMNGKIRNTY